MQLSPDIAKKQIVQVDAYFKQSYPNLQTYNWRFIIPTRTHQLHETLHKFITPNVELRRIWNMLFTFLSHEHHITQVMTLRKLHPTYGIQDVRMPGQETEPKGRPCTSCTSYIIELIFISDGFLTRSLCAPQCLLQIRTFESRAGAQCRCAWSHIDDHRHVPHRPTKILAMSSC